MSNSALTSEQEKGLQAALANITKQFGDEAISDMRSVHKNVAALSSGSTALDIALGIRGYPRGRMVEIYGPESSGKTTLCYHVIAQAQALGEKVAFIDAEHAMDAKYAEHLGVNIDDLLVSQPDYGEQALEIADMLARSGAVRVICIDSVAALTPRVELEGQMGDQTVGLQARMMSQACRKLRGIANQNNCLIIFTNQLREKVGVMFGSPETQPGGRALKFYASVRLDVRRIETIKEGTEAVANRVRVKVVKNKVAPPYKQAEFNIVYGEGVDNFQTLIDLGQEPEIGLVTKSGSFFTFVTPDEKAQGQAKAREYLREHPEVAAEIDAKIREVYLPDTSVDAAADEAEEAGAEETEQLAA